jgi:hypothetical protein
MQAISETARLERPGYVEPDGTRHRVTLRRVRRAWWLLDITDETTVIVDTVGYPDTIEAAWALAEDYSIQQQAWRLGLRDDDPLPQPLALGDASGARVLVA